MSTRDYVLRLYDRGEIGSLEEGATIAGVSRVTVRNWLVAAGIDWLARRDAFLARHRTRAVNGGAPKWSKPNKRQMRRTGEIAKADWDHTHEKP